MSETRVKALYTASMMLFDALMTGAAFIIGYWLRITVPFPSQGLYVQRFVVYLPMLLVQVLTVVIVFYFNRLYHVRRAGSRVDQFYAIFGAVSVGTMMAVAISSLTLKNSIFELDYPRAMILYAWLIGIALVTTLLGLGVAIPALTVFSIMRNRIDALTSEAMTSSQELVSAFRPAGKGG